MSPTLRAAQLIYTRVEPDYSPQRKSGFQTICQSASLTAAEVQAIEQRVRCFQQQADITRRQFFRLESGKLVCTHTRLLTNPDTTIIDATGRSGAYIVHCLILTAAQFAQLDENPFALFDHYPFQTEPQAMLAHIAATANDGYHTEVPALRANAPAPGWTVGAARRIVTLAQQAGQPAQKNQAVLLVGREEAITTAVRVAFGLLPRAQRAGCSFDTCIDRCTPAPGQYRIVGSSTRQGGGGFVSLDLERLEREGGADLPAGSDRYSTWLHALEPQRPVDAALLDDAALIQEVSQAFVENRAPDAASLAGLNATTCQELLTLFQPEMTQALKRMLQPLIGNALAEPLIAYQCDSRNIAQPDAVTELLTVATQPAIDAALVSGWLITWISVTQPRLKAGEWRKLLHLVEQTRTSAKLEQLEAYLLGLNRAELHVVTQSVQRWRNLDLPAGFQQALQRQPDEPAPQRWLLGFWKRR